MNIWETLRDQSLSYVIGVLIGAVVTGVYSHYKMRKIKAIAKQFSAQRGEREVILIISCRDNIKEAVHSQLPDYLNAAPIFYVHHDGSFTNDKSEWLDFARRIRSEFCKLQNTGPSRIYLFTNVPIAMAVFAGAVLDNGPEVVVHHYFNGTYQEVGRLNHESVFI